MNPRAELEKKSETDEITRNTSTHQRGEIPIGNSGGRRGEKRERIGEMRKVKDKAI